jgi:hypothetical protein
MAQAVSRRPLTADARVRSRVSPCGICGGQNCTGTGFSPRVLQFSPVNFFPPVFHYWENRKKLIIFITGLHNKPQGCGASVASAAGPFTTQKKLRYIYTALSVTHIKLLYTGKKLITVLDVCINLESTVHFVEDWEDRRIVTIKFVTAVVMLRQPVLRQKHRYVFYLAPTPTAGTKGSNFLCNAHSTNIIKSLLLHALFLTEITAPRKSQSGEFQDRVFCFDLYVIISPA